MRTALTALLVCLVALVLLACNSPPEPFFACQLEAARAVKRLVPFPSTFDVHDGSETYSQVKRWSGVSKHREGYWQINTGLVFGVENAFGVPSNFLVRYQAHMLDGECDIVKLEDQIPWE